jgi:hypothetical protein
VTAEGIGVKTTKKFYEWHQSHGSLLGKLHPGMWLALHANQDVLDKDSNSNDLIDRLQKLPPSTLQLVRLVYAFPPEFV